MKLLALSAAALFAIPVLGQVVAPFTADSYRLNPPKYLDKEVTLAVAYVMPSDHAREDGMQELSANTYNLNQFGGHIPIVGPPEIVERVARQCGTQHVWNHSHITFIRGVFKKDEAKNGRYYVLVSK
jgi:hypothetical protein